MVRFLVRDLLPVPGRPAGQGGRPESYCHRQMMDATIRYFVDNGIAALRSGGQQAQRHVGTERV